MPVAFFDGFDAATYPSATARYVYSSDVGLSRTDQGFTTDGYAWGETDYPTRAIAFMNTGIGRCARSVVVDSNKVHIGAWIQFRNNVTSTFQNSEFLSFRQRAGSGSEEGGEPHTKTLALGVKVAADTSKGYLVVYQGHHATGVDTGNWCGSLIETATGLVELDTWYKLEVAIDGGGSGTYEVRLDGETILQGVYVGSPWDRVSLTWESFGYFSISWDHFYILKDETDWLSGAIVTTVFPGGEDSCAWHWVNRSTDSTPWQAVDDHYNNLSLVDYIWWDGDEIPRSQVAAMFTNERSLPVGSIQAVNCCSYVRLNSAVYYNPYTPPMFSRIVVPGNSQEAGYSYVGRRTWPSGSTVPGSISEKQHYLLAHLFLPEDGITWSEAWFNSSLVRFGPVHDGISGRIDAAQVYLERLHAAGGGACANYHAE